MVEALFIMPCTGRKKDVPWIESGSWDIDSSVVKWLDEGYKEVLFRSRRTIAETIRDRMGFLHSSKPGPDLGFNKKDPDITYLPAYERYSYGAAYRSIRPWVWRKVLENKDIVDILFLSPLYGIARYTELIRMYDIDIEDQGSLGIKPTDIWRKKLVNLILNYCRNRGCRKIIILSSKRYRYNMVPSLTYKARLAGLNVEAPDLGSGYSVLNEIGNRFVRYIDQILQ